ncbi:MAG: hypothetical protein LBT78_02165 [Tannerella sp.]|jgi:hypothetical protein|nr:hypothetical protein [Tannerella sp.]
MWTTETVWKASVEREQIWKLWSDVRNWNVWDKDVEFSELFGNFESGTKGIMKPVGGPKIRFVMIECKNLQSFTDRSLLPLCKMDFIHKMTETKNGLEITHKVVMTGFLSFLFSKIMGKNMAKGLPLAVKKLVELAEITK